MENVSNKVSVCDTNTWHIANNIPVEKANFYLNRGELLTAKIATFDKDIYISRYNVAKYSQLGTFSDPFAGFRVLADGQVRSEKASTFVDNEVKSTLNIGNQLIIKMIGNTNMPFLDIDPNTLAQNNLKIQIKGQTFSCSKGQNLYRAFEEIQKLELNGGD